MYLISFVAIVECAHTFYQYFLHIQLHTHTWYMRLHVRMHIHMYYCKLYRQVRVEVFWRMTVKYPYPQPTTYTTCTRASYKCILLQLSVEVDTSRMSCGLGISQHDQVLLVPVKHKSSLIIIHFYVPTLQLVALAMSIRLTSS